MPRTTDNAGGAGGAGGAVHLLLTTRTAGLEPEDAERLMVEIQLRATQVGPVLEEILHEPRHEPHWGLNE